MILNIADLSLKKRVQFFVHLRHCLVSVQWWFIILSALCEGQWLVLSSSRFEDSLEEGNSANSLKPWIRNLLYRSSDFFREEIGKRERVTWVSVFLGQFIPHEVSEVHPWKVERKGQTDVKVHSKDEVEPKASENVCLWKVLDVNFDCAFEPDDLRINDAFREMLPQPKQDGDHNHIAGVVALSP